MSGSVKKVVLLLERRRMAFQVVVNLTASGGTSRFDSECLCRECGLPPLLGLLFREFTLVNGLLAEVVIGT